LLLQDCIVVPVFGKGRQPIEVLRRHFF